MSTSGASEPPGAPDADAGDFPSPPPSSSSPSTRSYAPPRLSVLAAQTVVARADLRSLTAPLLASLPEPSALLLFALLSRRLRLTPPLARAFAQCGHASVVAEVAKLDLERGVVGGFATSCRD